MAFEKFSRPQNYSVTPLPFASSPSSRRKAVDYRGNNPLVSLLDVTMRVFYLAETFQVVELITDSSIHLRVTSKASSLFSYSKRKEKNRFSPQNNLMKGEGDTGYACAGAKAANTTIISITSVLISQNVRGVPFPLITRQRRRH